MLPVSSRVPEQTTLEDGGTAGAHPVPEKSDGYSVNVIGRGQLSFWRLALSKIPTDP